MIHLHFIDGINYLISLQNIKTIHREDLIPENLFAKFNIFNDKEQVWRTYGNAYNNSIYDDRIISLSNNKISIKELRERNEKIILFHSIDYLDLE